VNAFEFVLALAIIVFAFTVIRHKMGIPVRSMKEMREGTGDDAENQRLRSQVNKLQNRINVLERIVTDRGADTAAQIEALRERDRMAEGDES
jgi:cell division protein FtsB